MKPFAESSEQNKTPILAVLKTELADNRHVLEVGAGTGQHAVFFAEHLPHLHWTCSDLEENHAGIRMWMDDAGYNNLDGPLLLDARERWPDHLHFDAIFSANAIHIMSWDAVKNLIINIGNVLSPGGKVCLYGPFMYAGEHTASSNANFDIWLKNRDPLSGVRDVSELSRYMAVQGIELVRDHEMPVNNRILVWEKL